MIIRSIRLQNIKSYGEGPDRRGVTVVFKPGTNGIAGKNGCGKTTLVEALGYALFLVKPDTEERLDKTTYLLRAGARAGEIDVTFECEGEMYRIECGLGSVSKRKTKVVQVSDESICAEGERGVSDFLCRLLGFAGQPERLTEIYSKVIGVRQGRLAWPFDSTAKEAKDFFEPLLDVAIFSDCFDRLKPVVDVFNGERQKENEKLAAVDERIRERRESPVLLERQKTFATREQLELSAFGESPTRRAGN
jgi:exonuclease SbcC